MKTQLTAIFLVLISCSEKKEDNPEKTEHTNTIVAEKDLPVKNSICSSTMGNHSFEYDCHNELRTKSAPDLAAYDELIEVYDCSESGKKHICNFYRKSDRNIEIVGQRYPQAPFELDEITNDMIRSGKTTNVIETFDSLMCEVGGNSAYDKYEFTRDTDGKVTAVKHYMAWFEFYEVDENGEELYYRDYTPDWFLGERVEIEYWDFENRIVHYNADNEIDQIITNIYDNKGRFVKQIMSRNDKCYNALYFYH